MNQIKILLTGVGVTLTLALWGQEQSKDSTLSRTVVVENQYNPEVMDAFKVNVLPKVEEPAVAKQHIDYATAIRPLSGWQGNPMPVLVRNVKPEEAYRGYVRAAYGNRNNTDVKMGYVWDITSRDRLDVMASLYGMHGDIPRMDMELDWKSRFFRTDASVDYKHAFDRITLNIGGAFASQVFNMYPFVLEGGEGFPDSQNFMLGDVYAGVASEDADLPIQFNVQTGFYSFKRKYAVPYLSGIAENMVKTTGQVWGTIQDVHTVGIGFDMNNVFYDTDLKNYTLLQLNPYYKWSYEEVNLRLGAHVDGQTANGSGIKVAPDLAFDYTFADTYQLYLQATGGTRLNDFRRLNELSPYWIQSNQIHSSYTPVDGQVGLKAAPMTGLEFKVWGGYRVVKDELFSVYSWMEQAKSKVAYAGGSIGYTYKDWINLDVHMAYYNWDMNEETEGYLVLKPNYEVGASARVKILSGLYASVDYQYEGRRQVGSWKKASPVNNLSAAADYRLFNRMNVFVRLNNLFNKHYVTEVGCPVQGFYVMGGLSFGF